LVLPIRSALQAEELSLLFDGHCREVTVVRSIKCKCKLRSQNEMMQRNPVSQNIEGPHAQQSRNQNRDDTQKSKV
jgi:hypothetical protein